MPRWKSGLATGVEFGVDEGFKHPSVINCDQIQITSNAGNQAVERGDHGIAVFDIRSQNAHQVCASLTKPASSHWDEKSSSHGPGNDGCFIRLDNGGTRASTPPA
jgi:hypothetical protein